MKSLLKLLFAICIFANLELTYAKPVAPLDFIFFDHSKCNNQPEFEKLCALYPGQYLHWTTTERTSLKKAVEEIPWVKISVITQALLASSDKPFYLVKIDDPTMEASSLNLNTQKIIFISSRLLAQATKYPFVSEQAYTLTHELLHFFISDKFGKDYYNGAFWQSLAEAIDWKDPRKPHHFANIAEFAKVFKETRQMIHDGKKEAAIVLDHQTARKYGFPSFYGTTQIEEFIVEVMTHSIYDPQFSATWSPSFLHFIRNSELKFLLDLQVDSPMAKQEYKDRQPISGFQFVGRLFLQAQPLCTVFLVAHGKAVTAKHCFREIVKDKQIKRLTTPSRVSMEFSSPDQSLIYIGGLQIKSFAEDTTANDWAYLEYDAQLTEGKLQIPQIEIPEQFALGAGAKVFSIGFPLPQKISRTEKFISRGQLTGKTGEIETILPNYSGPLHESTIPAWYLASGSPIFAGVFNKDLQYSQPLKLIGILSHTFEILPSGDPDPKKIQMDSWGPSTISNFSSVYLSALNNSGSPSRAPNNEDTFANPQEDYTFPLSVYVVQGTGWNYENVLANLQRTREIFKQCQMEPSPVQIKFIEPPLGHREFSAPNDQEIAAFISPVTKPALFFMGGDNRSEAYGDDFAEGSPRAPLIWTAWISNEVLRPEYLAMRAKSYNAVAHEIAHILGNCGHTDGPQKNLLAGDPALLSDHLTPAQCDAFKKSPLVSNRMKTEK